MPSYTVSSVNALQKYPSVSLTTATLELDGEDGVKTKFAAFAWSKTEGRDIDALIFLSHGYAEYLTRDRTYMTFAQFLDFFTLSRYDLWVSCA